MLLREALYSDPCLAALAVRLMTVLELLICELSLTK
jgi:hypothetical protein